MIFNIFGIKNCLILSSQLYIHISIDKMHLIKDTLALYDKSLNSYSTYFDQSVTSSIPEPRLDDFVIWFPFCGGFITILIAVRMV